MASKDMAPEKNNVQTLLTAVAWLLLLVVTVLAATGTVAFNENFFRSQYGQMGIAEQVGMSQEGLMGAVRVWIDYLAGFREDIDYRAEVDGVEREVFNEREKLHMVDVKALFTGGMRIAAGGLLVAAALLVVAGLTDCRGFLFSLARGYFWALAAFGLFFLLLGILFFLDFNWAFTQFHLIFFDNDLWQLDPRTDLMINMLPESFFFACVRRILATSLGVIAGLSLAMGWVIRRRRHVL